MKRDPLFFRLFKELPGCFFQLVGRSQSDAQRYALEAIEYKATSVRLDGVFRPLRPGDDPVYLWEAQFYASKKVYANLLSKIGRFLEHGDAEQDRVAVVIYPNRELEQKNLRPYRCLLESDQLVRIYLDELPPAPPDQFEKGNKKGIESVALRLLKMGRPVAEIVQATDLTPAQIRKLRNTRWRNDIVSSELCRMPASKGCVVTEGQSHPFLSGTNDVPYRSLGFYRPNSERPRRSPAFIFS